MLATDLAGRLLLLRARAAERKPRFRQAYELFIRAARVHDERGDAHASDDCRFRAALCIEKGETWRGNAAL